MRTKKEIQEKLNDIKKFLESTPKLHLLIEEERLSYISSYGAVQTLEWVLEVQNDWVDKGI